MLKYGNYDYYTKRKTVLNKKQCFLIKKRLECGFLYR